MSEQSKAPFLLRAITPELAVSQANFKDTHRKNFFILSTGRTATTFLAELFDGHDDVQGLHEPKPSRILRMWSMAKLDGKVSEDHMASVLYKKRRSLYDPTDPRVYIESNPFLIGFTETIHAVFRDPTIIHFVRDPRDFVTSALNHGNDRGLKHFFNTYVPYWMPDISSSVTGGNQELSLLEKTAAYWALANRQLVEYGKRHPDNYRLFRYEDVFGDNSEGMSDLIRFIGFDPDKVRDSSVSEAGVNKSRYNATPKWLDWKSEECKSIDNICEPLMSEFGYGQEEEWRKRL